MSWLSDIFSPKKQVAAELKQTPKLSEVAEYPLYKKTLEDRIAGLGLGFDQSVLDTNTAPYATSQRASFQNYTAPAISAKASSVGLGRSTIPVSQTRLGSQETENAIAERVAALTLENERVKGTEKQNAITGYGGLMTSDYNAMLNNIISQNEQAEAAAGAQNANSTKANANATWLRNLGIGGLLTAATAGTAPALGGISSLTSSGGAASLKGITSSDLMDYWMNRSKAMVNLA